MIGGSKLQAREELPPMSKPFPIKKEPGELLSQADQDACIQEMVRRIVDGFAPRRIFLFGSRAREEHHADSDVDLLIEVDGSPDTFETAVDMRMELSKCPLAKDLVVVGSDNWEARANALCDIVSYAMDEAKPLYERHA